MKQHSVSANLHRRPALRQPILNSLRRGALALAVVTSALVCVPPDGRAGGPPGGSAAAPRAAILTVTSNGDGGPGTLRDAVASAAAGDTIDFAVAGVITLTSGALVIGKSLTITGPGANNLTVARSTAPATPAFGIFEIAGGVNVTVSGLKITNGRRESGGSGGGILNQGTLTVNDCVVSDNFADGRGGGIAGTSFTTTTTINGSTVSNNSAGSGGGVANSGGVMTINGSTVSGNSAASGGGLHGNGNHLTVNDTTVSGNSAARGGGVYNTVNSRLLVVRSTISDNTITDQGGAIYNDSNTNALDVDLRNSTLSGNVIAAGAASTAHGSAIRNEGDNVALTNCTVTNNASSANPPAPAFSRTHPALVTSNRTRIFQLRNTVVSGNVGPNFGFTISPFFPPPPPAPAAVTLGHNLDSDGTSGFVNGVNGDIVGTPAAPIDAQLGPLQDNGGPTFTHALLCNSPAVNAGDNSVTGPPLNLTTDQRGRPRQAHGAVDIGAYEAQFATPCPTLSVNNVSVVEGNAGQRDAAFTFSLSQPSVDEVTFQFVTINGSASAASGDYVNASFTKLVIPAGGTSVTFAVRVGGDTLFEPDEDFFVNLSNPTGAVIANGTGTGLILNDDTRLQFSASDYAAGEADHAVVITVTRSGDLSAAVSADYTTADGTASERSDYAAALGTLRFAPGEASKTFTVLLADDSFREDAETVVLFLTNATGGATLGAGSVLTIADNDAQTGPNPIGDAAFFVRQHYHDLLNREPDPPGFAFWTNQIDSCGASAACREVRRINVSAAFFLSIEFQQTGYLVYRSFGAAFGTRRVGGAVPLTLREFLPDTQQISRGVVVNAPGWEQQVEANRQTYFDEFVLRPQFLAQHPPGMTPAAFVDALNTNAGGALSQSERDALVSDLTTGAKTRAQVLRSVAEDSDFDARERNRAFVLMQYFGYLRRNPDDAPEPGLNFGGYNFWLAKLDGFGGNYVAAEMVKAFITSGEYVGRFGP